MKKTAVPKPTRKRGQSGVDLQAVEVISDDDSQVEEEKQAEKVHTPSGTSPKALKMEPSEAEVTSPGRASSQASLVKKSDTSVGAKRAGGAPDVGAPLLKKPRLCKATRSRCVLESNSSVVCCLQRAVLRF